MVFGFLLSLVAKTGLSEKATKLVVIATLVGLAGFAIWYNFHIIIAQAKENGRLSADLEETEGELIRRVLAEKKNAVLMASYEKDQVANRKALAIRLNRIKQLEEESNETFRTCFDMPIPDAVLNSLRGENPHGKGTPASDPD